MLTVTNLSMSFQGNKLFDEVNLVFSKGNCYGVIGANGAGKSTFLKILEGKIEQDKGSVSIDKDERMSVLEQDHYKYDDEKVIDVVIMGNKKLVDIMKQKDEIYAKPDFNEEDGMKAAELEAEFAEMGGWEAESEAGSLLLGIGIGKELHEKNMGELLEKEKIKVLLAKALFGKPEILILDEPTNGLDVDATLWLEDFLLDFEGTVIVVSHDRYFLNTVCTHMVDIDYKKIKIYVGNYDFWYESSELAKKLLKEQNKKKEDKIKELQDFIQRFSANKSKSRQATSRKKLLEKIDVEDIMPSSRRYPFVGFTMEREVGNQILEVNNLTKVVNGEKVLDNVSFTINHNNKVAFVGNDLSITALFEIIAGEDKDYEGDVKWGVTASFSYFPKDNTKFFENTNLNLIDWLRQYSKDQSEIYIRGFLGRMLFSGEEALKPAKTLSGGEKVRVMLSRMMLKESNVLILDEPTNHLDLESITSVNNGLVNFKGNILFSSNDIEFIDTISNRVIDLDVVKVFDKEMKYSEYIENKNNF